ncbi:MAG: hypothetical protein IPN76_15260 [Saprospiraceae bacterium]|nr:hypothetical protein [Saprospiraceae bacterium]
MKLSHLFIYLYIAFLPQLAAAQSNVDANAFRAMSTAERLNYVYDPNRIWKDTTEFLAWYRPMLAAAKSEGDEKAIFALLYEHFQQRHAFYSLKGNVGELESELLEAAKAYDVKEGEIVAEHYVQFGKNHHQHLSNEQLYAYILVEYERMEDIGFDNFKPFDIARLLYHSGRFMFQLEDYEKALKILLTAEKYTVPKGNGLQVWIFIKNHIQSIYQRQKQYDLSIPYAKKIIEVTSKCASDKPSEELFCKTWLGIASVDIASMLIGQGKYEEGERYANEGYALLKSPLDAEAYWLRAEYDMLQVLISTKLELKKLDEAGPLLKRAAEIASILDQKEEPEYFKHVKFYQSYARYYELRGDFAEAVRYANFAKPLQDSLERRNDARTLEKIQQRMAAEKYTEQLKLVESEKQLQTMLRNAAIVIMLLMGGLAYGNYKRLQHKRKQAAAELEAARSELATFTQSLREKSELAENLRLELDKLSRSGERSEYLEKLTQSTILTDEDWTQFRSIFEKVHPNFIEVQKTQYPDLTQAELRYLVLEKLQLTTHEMANMLGVSDGTIRQTKMRMKKKVVRE